MGQYRESQYDDDLTLDAEEYDDSFASDIDLFAFAGEEDSPISRLKSLVLSLDWEITDTVLLQFNDEILYLKDIWADDRVNMVYLQALEKIGKYIYREKADAHPNSIMLLLGMYFNLERIVLSDELDDAEKKQILAQDVRRFEKLKKLIAERSLDVEVTTDGGGGIMAEDVTEVTIEQQTAPELVELKALVLGIDWEITEQQLLDLRNEVKTLQQQYADSRPRLVFLQGIGTLGSYIRKRKADSHQDAFKILKSFFEGLEQIVQTPGITLAEEKQILIPEVKKFEAFKQVIAQEKAAPKKDSVPPAAPAKESGPAAASAQAIAPAFADMPDDVRGFQEEEEAAALGLESSANVDARLSSFFGAEQAATETQQVVAAKSTEEKEVEAFSEAFFGMEAAPDAPSFNVDPEIALKGVDVETEADDDSDEEALPVFGGEVAPALADSNEISEFSEPEPAAAPVVAPEEPAPALSAAAPKKPVPPAPEAGSAEEEIDNRLASIFGSGHDDSFDSAPAFSGTAAELALQGVDVETEGDDDSDQVEAVTGPALEGLGMESKPAPAFEKTVAGVSSEEPEVEEIAFEFATPEPGAEAGEPISETAAAEVPPEPAPAFASPESSDADLQNEATPQEEPESHVANEVEGQLDQFFDLEEAEEVPAVEPVVEDEIMATSPSDEEVFTQLDEEEVVFDLAADEELAAEEPVVEFAQLIDEPEAAVKVEPEAEPAVTVTFTEDDLELEEILQGIPEPDLLVDEPAAIAALPAEEPEAPAEEVSSQGTERFLELRGCIESLELQLDDAIISGLYEEIDELRGSFADNPVEKSYLQLISTVCRHIDKFRYDSDDRSNALLAGILADLEKASTAEPAAAHETLLAHTGEVLQWQHEMLAAAAEARAKSVAAEEIEESAAAAAQFAAFPAGEAVVDEEVPLTDKQLSEVVRREIDVLKDALKHEIDELRKAMHTR